MILYKGLLPDFEVGENQLTSRESYPVNTPASMQQIKPGLLLHSFIMCYNSDDTYI